MNVPVNEPMLDGNEKKYLAECIDTGWISSEGPFVARFEKGMAALTGRRHGVAVANGSVALDVALQALKLEPGSEVILPSFTIVSCALAVVRAGCVPVLVDSDPLTWNMDVAQVEAKITPRTAAVILLIAGGHGFEVLEDVEMIEVKQGPYVGEGDKTRFVGVPSGLTRYKFAESQEVCSHRSSCQ